MATGGSARQGSHGAVTVDAMSSLLAQPMQLRPDCLTQLPHPAASPVPPPPPPPQHMREPGFTHSPPRLSHYATHPHQGGPSMGHGIQRSHSASTCISHPIPGFDVGGLILGAKSINRLPLSLAHMDS